MNDRNTARSHAATGTRPTLAAVLGVLMLVVAAFPVEARQGGAATPAGQATQSSAASSGVVTFNSDHTYQMLDPTTWTNRKVLLLLDHRQDGMIGDKAVVLGGAVTAIMDYQKSDTAAKFGYLMRHPTASNEVGSEVSEAVIHSAQLSVTGTPTSWVTAYAELLYDPEQSFGAGTTTALTRNQVQLRRGYVLMGDLAKSPVYFALGKMDTPFGLTDTVNPFTASTVWHAFGGLAYGAQAGYSRAGLDVTAMAVQGGSQFRAANTPVEGTAVPSKLNNYVVDANYTAGLGSGGATLMAGASYERGSTYCQGYPVTHFSACEAANPAFDVYGELYAAGVTVIAEFARTRDAWPGTFNPDLPAFAASKVTSWDLGGKYRASVAGRPVDLSLDFSRFLAGPEGAPWHRQDQLVAGIAPRLGPGTKFFAEFIHVAGYAPLNFISGGNLGIGETHSDNGASSNLVVFGVNVAF
ncbi:MAG: hypothetical protein AB7H88_13435 [Vicinamibacterales bacterium]